MKFIFKNLIYVGLLFPSIFFAQTDDLICGTQDTSYNPPNVYSHSTDPSVLGVFEPVVYNIYFWGIDKADGS